MNYQLQNKHPFEQSLSLLIDGGRHCQSALIDGDYMDNGEFGWNRRLVWNGFHWLI